VKARKAALADQQYNRQQGPHARGRQQQRPAEIGAGRHARELAGKEFEMILDQREVGSRLSGLSPFPFLLDKIS
jgi:hypothetical protein